MTIFYVKKRTLSRVICVFIITVLLIVEWICFEKEIVVANEHLSMYSQSYALMDGETGRILCGKEENIPMANASTTKILTCIITLENNKLDEMVTISSLAASQPRVKLGVQEGEQYQLQELLYGLMLESYNDCAVAIAEHVSGSVENFAKKMNEKAKELGCKDTYFITPNGLDAADESGFHHTTAEDLCRIMAYCTWKSPQKEAFLHLTQTRNYGEFINHNAFLNQMDGVLTGKTGFTNKAGYCYVAAMERNGEKYCIALLACGWPNNKDYKWKDARTLFEYGLENYDTKTVLIKKYIEEIKVDGYVSNAEFNQLNKEQKLVLHAKEHEYKVLMGEEDQIKTEKIVYSKKALPIKQGEKMGECKVYINNVLVDSYPLVASENVNIWGWKEIIYTIFYQFLTFSL